MPIAAPKPCTQCGVLVRDGTSRCPAHPKPAWVQKAKYKRVSGRKLQQQRHDLFSREPFCRTCRGNGHLILATIRDHIKPLAEGGTDTDDNVQPLCQPCSDAKTEQERKRGVGRSHQPATAHHPGVAPPYPGVGGGENLGASNRKPTA